MKKIILAITLALPLAVVAQTTITSSSVTTGTVAAGTILPSGTPTGSLVGQDLRLVYSSTIYSDLSETSWGAFLLHPGLPERGELDLSPNCPSDVCPDISGGELTIDSKDYTQPDGHANPSWMAIYACLSTFCETTWSGAFYFQTNASGTGVVHPILFDSQGGTPTMALTTTGETLMGINSDNPSFVAARAAIFANGKTNTLELWDWSSGDGNNFRGLAFETTDTTQFIYSNYSSTGVDSPISLSTFANRSTQLLLNTNGVVSVGAQSSNTNAPFQAIKGSSAYAAELWDVNTGSMHGLALSVTSAGATIHTDYAGSGADVNLYLGTLTMPLTLELATNGDAVFASTVSTTGILSSGTVSASSGTNEVYRCVTAGAVLPIGSLTITAADCGTTADTGFRAN